MHKKRERTVLRTLVYFMILLVPMLVMMEAVIRLSPLHAYLSDDGYGWGKQYHHIYGWEPTPNYHGTYFDWVTDKPGEIDLKYRRTIAINSAGFRDDEETTLEKPADTVRIFTLGDSITFGWGMESEDTFTKVLQKRLNESSSGRKYEVINAGIIGFTSYQGVRLLEHKLLKYNPDIIIVAYGGTNYVLSDTTDEERVKRGSPFLTKMANLGRNLHIYRGLKEVMLRMNKKEKKELTQRVSFQDFREHLGEIIRISKENGVGVVLMTIQSNVLSGQVSKWTIEKRSLNKNRDEVIAKHREMNDIIREAAAEDGAVLADIAEKFVALKEKEDRKLFYRSEDAWDDYHPNKEGHRIIGEELFKAVSMNFPDKKAGAM